MSYSTVTTGVTPFMRRKYENEAQKHWTKFYQRNGDRFYKDRNWLNNDETDGFPMLNASAGVVVEAGCGAANAAFPLLQKNPELRVFAFDFAPSAVQLVRGARMFDPERMTAFVWDFANDEIESVSAEERGSLATEVKADFCLCLFVLSAVPPELHVAALTRLQKLLKPGGLLLFRDYCSGDLAAARFKQRSRIEEDYYVRQDGTLSYFFDDVRLHSIASEAGLRKEECRRIERLIRNRKEAKEMHRVFLQAVYRKPDNA